MPVAFLIRAGFVTAALGLIGFAALDAHAQTAVPRSIAVTGTGEVTAAPEVTTLAATRCSAWNSCEIQGEILCDIATICSLGWQRVLQYVFS